MSFTVGGWAVKVHSPFPSYSSCVLNFIRVVGRSAARSLAGDTRFAYFRGILLLCPLKWKLALNGVDDDVCVCFCNKHQ